jgi:hypothetical protein
MKIWIKKIFLLLITFQFSCLSKNKSEAENYRDAYLVTINDTFYLKLKGKRVPLHNSGTYEDSELIPIPKLSGRIEGKGISVKKGYYDYQGYILIDSSVLKINLLVNDTDDKKLRRLSWNGDYRLIK